MTLIEFKAWFDGFTEAMTSSPNEAQWKRIKERVAEIDDKPVTERHFIDRYWHHQWWPAPPVYPSYPYWYTTIGGIGTGNTSNITGTPTFDPNTTVTFNSTAAMQSLGQAEALQYAPYRGYETLTTSTQ